MNRAAKNDNNVIIVIGSDENQTGNYPAGSSDEQRVGVWCAFAFESIPECLPVEGQEEHALRFKENDAQDGIELRSDEDVLASPQG